MNRTTFSFAMVLAALLAITIPPTAAAQFGAPRPAPVAGQNQQPKDTEGVDFVQKLGSQVPMGTTFTDETGAKVSLRELGHGKPIVLVPAYYECPMLCSLVLDGAVSSLDTLEFDAGKEYEMVVISFDPGETPKLAAESKRQHMAKYDHADGAAGFHFLTGDKPSIDAVMDAIGFRYKYIPRRDEYSHSAGIVVLTPEGKVARYFYGVEYPPRDVRLALVEASDMKIGSPVDKVILYCCRYDPETGRYSAAILNIIRVAGVLTLAAIGLFFLWSWRRGHHHETVEGEA